MSLRRLRLGELVALLGAALLVGSLFLNWVDLERTSYTTLEASQLPDTGFTQLGWVVWGTACAAAGLALVAALLTARGSVGTAVMATILTVTFAGFALALVLLRLLLDQPDLGADVPGSAVGVAPGGWLGLAGALLLLAGAWRAMGDERTDAPDSVYDPPPARPAPPPSADPAQG